MRINILVFVLFFLFSLSQIFAQGTKWKRRVPESKIKTQLFHSIQSVNLPTAETLQKGDFNFEISHRFIPTIKSGAKEFWGFDGSANIRLALGYAITDNTLLTLGRSNFDNNIDLTLKQWAFQIDNDFLPITTAVLIGAAYNSDVPNVENNLFQYFVQVPINTMFANKVGIGIVPSYLYNSHIQCEEAQYSFTLGTNIQFYFNEMYSIILEWNPTVIGWRQDYNPVALGFEIETGGHFFKIILTNSSSLNTTQFLSVADKSFDSGEWRFGFNISRVL